MFTRCDVKFLMTKKIFPGFSISPGVIFPMAPRTILFPIFCRCPPYNHRREPPGTTFSRGITRVPGGDMHANRVACFTEDIGKVSECSRASSPVCVQPWKCSWWSALSWMSPRGYLRGYKDITVWDKTICWMWQYVLLRGGGIKHGLFWRAPGLVASCGAISPKPVLAVSPPGYI